MQHEFPAGGDNDRTVTRVLWRSLALVAAVTILTAYFSDLYYFPDEHYQILEFMSNKLGITAAADMPWEYSARIRPWMQPFLYYLIAGPLLFAGVKDLFVVTFILRLATGFLSLAALALFAKETLAGIEGKEEKLAFARYLPLFGFLPYLFVRTASETISAAFFTLSLAMVMRSRSMSRVLCAGFLSGLAFECRYQSAILILGLSAWLIFVARLRGAALAAFVAATLAPVGLGAVIDRWGYGAWGFPPLLYFKTNILDGVAAKSYGTGPGLCLSLHDTGEYLPADLRRSHGGDGRHVGAQSAPCRDLGHDSLLSWSTRLWRIRNRGSFFLWPFWRLRFRYWDFPRFCCAAAIGRRTPGPGAARAPRNLSPLRLCSPCCFLPSTRSASVRTCRWRNISTGIFPADSPLTASMPSPSPPIRCIVRCGFGRKNWRMHPALETQLARGPVYLFSNTPTLAGRRLCPPARGPEIIYSEFPLAGFGYDALGTRYLHAFAAFAAREAWLKLPPLYWITLFRVERASSAIRS